MKYGVIFLADMIDYKISSNKGLRWIFVIIDNFSKYLWAMPFENKNTQIITQFQVLCLFR